MKKIKLILGYVKPYRKELTGNILFNLASTVFSLFSFATVIPFLKILFSSQEKGNDVNESTGSFAGKLNRFAEELISGFQPAEALLLVCLFILVTVALKNFAKYISLFYMAKIRTGIVRDLRKQVHDKVVSLPVRFFTHERKGNIISRATNDVSEIEWSVLGSLEMLFRDPVTVTIYLVTLFLLSPQLTAFVLVVLPISGFIISRAATRFKKAARRGQDQLGNLISKLEENITGIKIIKAFNAQKFVKASFDKENDSYFRLMKRLNRKQYLASPITETLGASAVAVVLWFGGNLVLEMKSGLNGEFFIGYLVIFSQLLVPARSVSEAIMRMQKGFAASERINEILSVPPLIREHPDAVEKNDFTSSLSFSHVSFSYGEKNVLNDIQLEIKKGETVALVGSSGSGKSTLAELILRFHDVTSGDILLDGISIKEIRLHSLRQLTGLVTQETVLFNDTVFSNIAFGNPNASLHEVTKAARSANALEFIEKLPQTFETNIGERGNRLSGGQKQRLGIARALLKNPPILILDEATSALDTESEKLVQEAIENLMQNRTVIVIAHRLSTIKRAGKIIVIENGTITETGTHENLLASAGTYKRLYELQSFD